jgi:hypothetical protein
MPAKPSDTPLQRIRNRYRLVVMNDDTYEEVVTFKLSRLSVYVALSSLFILLTGLTVALIVFTPLKMYIPGYGSTVASAELRALKIRTDSLEQSMRSKQQYLEIVRGVLKGDQEVKLDTTSLNIPEPERITE